MRIRGLSAVSATTAGVAAVCFLTSGHCCVDPQGVLPTLTTAHEAHNLPVEEAARAYPVHLRAVVTYYDQYIAHDIDPQGGVLFVCDRTACIAVHPPRPILPIHAGDMVDVTGVSDPGGYAPIVNGHEVRFIAKSHLPQDAPRAAFSRMLSGAFDGQWVQVEGRVRNVHLKPHNVVFEIAAEGGSFRAVTLRQPGADYKALIDSLVRIRGNAAPVFNQNRQMVGVHVYFPSLHELSVIQAAPRDPFAIPVVPVSELFRYTPDPGILHQVHVQGRVTLDWPGHQLCVIDGNSGICMQTAQADSVALGTFVDVVGFPAIDLLKPTLEDALFRTVGAPAVPASPVVVADETLQGKLDGKLVQIEGELVGRDFSGSGPTLLLRTDHLLFPVILPPQPINGNSLPWKEGSLLRVTGICNVQFDTVNIDLGDDQVRPLSARILLRSASDIAVLHAPSWWTPQHTLEGFAAVGLVILACFTWIIVLRRRVEQQTRALRANEERLRHLSEHDALTGMPNRLLLDDRLRTALQRAERFQTCLGLLMVDVDGFKEVNDELGHQAGDELLCCLAGRLCTSVRATDTVARIGGDEFVVLLPDLRLPTEAETIARKIVSAVAEPFLINQMQNVISISVGVVTFPEEALSADALIRCADEAMYAAKREGKNCIQVYRANQACFNREERAPLCEEARGPVNPETVIR